MSNELCGVPPTDSPVSALAICSLAAPQAQPGVTLESARLGHELWKLYLGPKSAPAPGARKTWLAALPALE